MIAEKSNLELREDHALDYFQNIVETVREPLVILDSDLRVPIPDAIHKTNYAS